MAVEKQRTLHYRHAVLFQGGALNLQALMSQALETLKDVESREQTLVTGGSTKRVLSGIGATKGILTAKLMQYTAGQKTQFLEKDDATGDYKLDAISPPADKGKKVRREFVESLLYLAVFEDHVAYIGSQILSSKALEDHINWLLRTTGKLASEDIVILRDQQSQKALSDIAKHPVSKVEIGGDLNFEHVEEVPPVRKTKTAERVEGYKLIKPKGDSAEALRALLGDWFGDAPLKAALKREEVIEFKLQLVYKNRKKTKEGFELMERLAVAGRHFDADDCRVHLHKGGFLKGDDLKLQAPLRVEVADSGLIAEPDVWERIHTWLRNAIGKNVIGG